MCTYVPNIPVKYVYIYYTCICMFLNGYIVYLIPNEDFSSNVKFIFGIYRGLSKGKLKEKL